MQNLYTELAPGLTISRALTGMWQIADLERSGQTLDPLITSLHMAPYLESGLTTFDMADHYGSAEIIAGTFRKKHPLGKDAVLFTKWVPKPGKSSFHETKSAVELALDRMQMEQIPLLQYHAWNYLDPTWLDQLFWLKELKEEGLIGNLGVTNFDAAHLRIACASGIPIVSNQVSHSFLDDRASQEIADVCQAYPVKILAYGTLAGGFLSNKWLNSPEPELSTSSTWSQMKYKRFIDAAGGWKAYQQALEILHDVAKKHHISVANVADRKSVV